MYVFYDHRLIIGIANTLDIDNIIPFFEIQCTDVVQRCFLAADTQDMCLHFDIIFTAGAGKSLKLNQIILDFLVFNKCSLSVFPDENSFVYEIGDGISDSNATYLIHLAVFIFTGEHLSCLVFARCNFFFDVILNLLIEWNGTVVF